MDAQLSFADVDPTADVVVAGDHLRRRRPGDHRRPRHRLGRRRPVDAITEIGAVKVRGGEVLGEFATLVDPQRSIPPQIVQLTGITTAMVHDAPTIDAVLPMFLEFARGAVLVAHNAGFDIGFLRAAAERCDIAWPRPPVLCTVRLARRVLTREEAPSVRLAALAAALRLPPPSRHHRALDDARATVDVLHALIERVGNQGVHTYTDLRSLPARRHSAPSAASGSWPRTCRTGRGSTCSAARPARCSTSAPRSICAAGSSQYFNGADPRGRMKEMVALATAVDHVECAHDAGGRGARAAAAGRARPAVQPPVAVSRTAGGGWR